MLAVAFVASPFYVRQAIAAFEAVDPALLDAARTLGASPGRTFRRVALPLAAGGLVAGWVLAFARGVGEFGATIIFAGNVRGRDADAHAGDLRAARVDFDVALAIGLLLVVLSAVVLAGVQAHPAVATLALDLDVPLRRFALRLALDVDPGDASPSSAPRAPASRPSCAPSPGCAVPTAGRVALGDDVWFDAAARRAPAAGAALGRVRPAGATRSSRT